MPDHATPSKLKTHSPEPVPFALMTSSEYLAAAGPARRYTEAEGSKTGVSFERGHELIGALFDRARKSASN
jgi:2,3-bisphosphoglycerate-independent phosphoglycerate mutase